MEFRFGRKASDGPEGCTEAAAHVENAGRGFAGEMKAVENLAIHLFEHGLPVEGVHAGQKEAEVHIEVRAPCSVVGAGLFVVALEVVFLKSFCERSCCDLGHQSSLLRCDFGSMRVIPLPMLMMEWRVEGGSFLTCVYQP